MLSQNQIFINQAFAHTDPYKIVKKLVSDSYYKAVQECCAADDVSALAATLSSAIDPIIELPKNPEHGDFATNIAMLSARTLKIAPVAFAKFIITHLVTHSDIYKVEIAGPGFINITMSAKFWHQMLHNIVQDTHFNVSQYSDSNSQNKQKINLEFVSANPTGPMHLGHIRGAIYGDVCANVLSYMGHDVTREYYINDSGEQTKTVVKSLWLRYLQILGHDVTIDADCYPGEYLIDLAKDLHALYGDSLLSTAAANTQKYDNQIEALDLSSVYDKLYAFAMREIMLMIKADLQKLGVQHDVFVSEKKDIVDGGLVTVALNKLKDKGLTYIGSLQKPLGYDDENWVQQDQTIFRSTAFGDDEDRVLIKSNGSYTYLAPDIAYHDYKHQRGFDRMILLLGADHAGYVKRLKATVAAVSDGKAHVDVLLMQLIKLYKDGELLKMSKRAGTFVTLNDVIDELGRDILRFLMLWRKCDSPFNIDIDKAKEQSKDNPVFYVQYAHTRAVSIIDKAKGMNIIDDDEFAIFYKYEAARFIKKENAENIEMRSDDILNMQSVREGGEENLKEPRINYSSVVKKPLSFDLLSLPHEVNLIKKISAFENIMESAAITMEMHRLPYYLHELAAEFNAMWNQEQRFISDDIELSRARVTLVYACAKTIGKGLNLMGILPLSEM